MGIGAEFWALHYASFWIIMQGDNTPYNYNFNDDGIRPIECPKL